MESGSVKIGLKKYLLMCVEITSTSTLSHNTS